MPDEEAVLLLTRILGADRVAREPQGARSLAAACGGLPLAIRIADARLAVLRHLSLSRYAARLADEGRLLDELVAGDLEIRSRLAVWYADLAPGDREWAHRLAALPGSAFSAAQLGGDPVRAEHAVERLFEAHVVRIQLGRGRGARRERWRLLRRTAGGPGLPAGPAGRVSSGAAVGRL
nr:hypothetical protein GCM10020092_035410 [Actinoplanes digitatis]